MKIAIFGNSYMGFSLIVFIAQHHDIIAVEVAPEKNETNISISKTFVKMHSLAPPP